MAVPISCRAADSLRSEVPRECRREAHGPTTKAGGLRFGCLSSEVPEAFPLHPGTHRSSRAIDPHLEFIAANLQALSVDDRRRLHLAAIDHQHRDFRRFAALKLPRDLRRDRYGHRENQLPPAPGRNREPNRSETPASRSAAACCGRGHAGFPAPRGEVYERHPWCRDLAGRMRADRHLNVLSAHRPTVSSAFPCAGCKLPHEHEKLSRSGRPCGSRIVTSSAMQSQPAPSSKIEVVHSARDT